MKYKVGDKVLIKATVEKVTDDYVRIYAEGYGERSFSLANAPVEHKTYESGLADAWELARKIGCVKEEGGMSCDVLEDVYGLAYAEDVFAQYTVEEALAKIEAYEKEKEIKVGDVVEGLSGYKAVVTIIGRDRIQVMFDDGSHTEWNPKDIKKTGKHIDIESLLRQIGE